MNSMGGYGDGSLREMSLEPVHQRISELPTFYAVDFMRRIEDLGSPASMMKAIKEKTVTHREISFLMMQRVMFLPGNSIVMAAEQMTELLCNGRTFSSESQLGAMF